tara:strand:+ start:8347 stop:8811 length:465 start_codon:yes stop_codon:yes gene_type:complete
MFEKKSKNDSSTNNDLDVFKPSKGPRRVVVGEGVQFKGEITQADEVQVDGSADLILETDNMIVGSTGSLKGNIKTDNADIWGKADGELKISGTLTIQEQGSVTGSIEYQNLHIKLGGKISGDIKVSDKVKKISDSQKKDSASLQDSSEKQNSSA